MGHQPTTRRPLAVWSLLSLLVALTGCQDPRLALKLSVPPPYREQLNAIALEVLSLSPGETADCDAAAFGELDTSLTRLEFSKEIDLKNGDSSIPLAGIDRQSAKLFIARGRDAGNRTLVVACAALNEPVTGETTLALNAEPATRARWLDTGGAAVSGIDTPLPTRAVFEVRDLFNTKLGNTTARWYIRSSAAPTPPQELRTSDNGQAQLNLDLTIPSGPAVLEVRTRWAAGAALRLRGLEPPTSLDASLAGHFLTVLRLGRVGPTGEMGFAALTYDLSSGGSTAASHVAVRYYDRTSGTLPSRLTAVREPNSVPMALLLYPEAGRDRVILLASDAWKEIQADGSVTIISAWTPPPADWVRAWQLGPCAPSDDILVLVEVLNSVGESQSWQVFNASGAPVPSHPLHRDSVTERLYGTGCLSDTAGGLWPVAIEGTASARWRVWLPSGETLSQISSGPHLAFGFTTDTQAGGSRPLWVSDLDLDGATANAQTLPVTDLDWGLETSHRAALLQQPFMLVGGRFDSDEHADLAALTSITTADGSIALFVQVVLAGPDGVTLSGSLGLGNLDLGMDDISEDMIQAMADAGMPSLGLWAADFTGNGRDDLLVLHGWELQSASPRSNLQLLLFGTE